MKIRLLILSLLTAVTSFATHIVGGSFSLSYISGDRYELKLNVLRDCTNGEAPFDGEQNTSCTVGIFDLATHRLMEYVDMGRPAITKLSMAGPNCANMPNACTEMGVYNKVLTFNPSRYNSTKGYYVTYQRCCRNNIIVNIAQPEAAAIAVYMEIPPFGAKNSTPYFTNNPFTYLCTNNPFTYNMNFADPDGDKLVYSMTTPVNGFKTRTVPSSDTPRSGPYPMIRWIPPFSDGAQIDGSPSLGIDPVTGEISVSPANEGVYVASIKVEEYRLGKKLGEVHLQLQFNVTSCLSNLFPSIAYQNEDKTWGTGNYSIKVLDKLCFDVLISDVSDSLDIKIEGPPGINDTLAGNSPQIEWLTNRVLKQTSAKVCWQPSCEYGDSGTYVFNITAVDNGCPISKKSASSFSLRAISLPLVNPTDILCMTLVSDQQTNFTYGDSTTGNPLFRRYHIYRAVDDDNFVLYDSVFDRKVNNDFLDFNTPGNRIRNYKYFMRGVNICNVEGPPSDTSGTNDHHKPVPDTQKLNTVTVVNNDFIKVVWPETWEKDFARYFLYKSTRDAGSFSLVRDFTDIADTVYYDKEVNVHDQSYCYYLVMKDTCDNYSAAGRMSCSILLKGKSVPFESHIGWSPYTYWDNSIENYNVYRADLVSPFASLTNAKPSINKMVDDRLNRKSGKFSYYIEAVEKPLTNLPGGNSVAQVLNSSRSNEIELIQGPHLYVPNAYSANADGSNDAWEIRDVFVKDYDLKVYNKWGQAVFETKDKNVWWDGLNKDGSPAPGDVYIYIVTYTGWDDSVATMRGNVTILR